MLRYNHPILDEKGEVKYIYITYTEITKAVKISEYLRNEKDAFISVYEAMAEGDLIKRHPVTRPQDADLIESYEFLTKLRTAVRGLIINL